MLARQQSCSCGHNASVVSIIKTQVQELQSIGIKAVNLANEEIYAKEVVEGRGLT